jgi:hypothetical protein
MQNREISPSLVASSIALTSSSFQHPLEDNGHGLKSERTYPSEGRKITMIVLILVLGVGMILFKPKPYRPTFAAHSCKRHARLLMLALAIQGLSLPVK